MPPQATPPQATPQQTAPKQAMRPQNAPAPAPSPSPAQQQETPEHIAILKTAWEASESQLSWIKKERETRLELLQVVASQVLSLEAAIEDLTEKLEVQKNLHIAEREALNPIMNALDVLEEAEQQRMARLAQAAASPTA